MPDNRQVKRNVGVSNPSVDHIQEAVRKLRVESNEKEDGNDGDDDLSIYPDRPGEPDCIYFLRTGMCGYGATCRFNHPSNLPLQIGQYEGEFPQRIGQPDCEYFLKTGMCKYGSSCKYHHRLDRNGAGPVMLNTLGLPMRQDEKPCPYYMRTGACKFGIACKFHHSQPDHGVSVTRPSHYGSTTSSGLSYGGGRPAWSLPKTTYISPPGPEGQQTYVPVIYPPSQGMVSAPEWNTYMSSMSPAPSTNVYGESGFSGHIPLSYSGISHLPERPDQPECRYFMNNGSCKYGSDCKYHHPREKIALLAAGYIGPLGLPLRPGQAVCSYYSMYGLCKFGPTCRYDHPLLGYSYNYGSSMPAVSIHSTNFSYQLNPPAIYSSGTSPSKSPKIPNCTTKQEAASNKKLDAKAPEDSPKQARSPSASAEVPEGHSD
ncbi:Zinc finger CCCH domain-containing protein 3 [Heracleum sosnowskyi]|uniref:Zinc finger CCCH domain-containing protein 3 n=1 Tax=Heracleum sosnowskyi TaxID=360622 RepID=A0AAD8MZM0_9APIA|nr:Zinc finger CCCH domain-containing protein 3 [Heracleum sosnowskyi]